MKSQFIVLALLNIVLCTQILSQSSTDKWIKVYGGTLEEKAIDIEQTIDSGYIILSYREISLNNNGHWLLKTDSKGDTIWTKFIQGHFNYAYVDGAVKQTADSGYVIVGNDGSSLYLAKLNSFGEVLWSKSYGHGYFDTGTAICQTTDGGYGITGIAHRYFWKRKIWLLKTNSRGDTLWTRIYGSQHGLNSGFDIQLDESGFIVCGETYINGNLDYYVSKTDLNGNTIWQKNFNALENTSDVAFSVEHTIDSGYILAGATSIYTWLIKIDSQGDTVWTRILDGPLQDICVSIKRTYDNSFIISGVTSSFGPGDFNIWLVKINSSGDTLWSRTYGSLQSKTYGKSVIQSIDKGYVVAGHKFENGNNDLIIVKTDSLGNTVQFPVFVDENIKQIKNFTLLENYPNPFNPATTIKYKIPEIRFVIIKVYDVVGEKVATLVNEEKPAGEYEIKFDGTGLPSGIYFYQLRAGNFIETKKMVLLR